MEGERPREPLSKAHHHPTIILLILSKHLSTAYNPNRKLQIANCKFSPYSPNNVSVIIGSFALSSRSFSI